MKANRADMNRNPIARTLRTDFKLRVTLSEPLLLDLSLFGYAIRISKIVANERRVDA